MLSWGRILDMLVCMGVVWGVRRWRVVWLWLILPLLLPGPDLSEVLVFGLPSVLKELYGLVDGSSTLD
jgi:hypothetical protein